MIAVCQSSDTRSRRPSTAPTDGAAGRHWSHSTFYVRVPDLNDETRRRIARAGSTWDLLWRALRSQERRGRTAEVKAAAARAVLLDVGVAGLARMGGQHPATVARHLATLAVVGLVKVTRQEPRIERDDRGRIKGSSGREKAAVIELTIGPDHLRPFGAQRVHPPRSLSVRSAYPSRSPIPTGLGNQSRTPEPPRVPAVGAGPRSAAPAAEPTPPPPASATPVLAVPERIDDSTEPSAVIVRCEHCHTTVRLTVSSATELNGLASCPKCKSPVIAPTGTEVAGLVAAGRITNIERNRMIIKMKNRQAGHAAGRAGGLTAADREGEGSPGPAVGPAVAATTSTTERGPEPEPAGPVATPAVAATASSPHPLPAAGGRDDRPAQATPEAPEDDDEVAMLERMIDEQRKRDAGYVVPACIDKAIVARLTGRCA